MVECQAFAEGTLNDLRKAFDYVDYSEVLFFVSLGLEPQLLDDRRQAITHFYGLAWEAVMGFSMSAF